MSTHLHIAVLLYMSAHADTHRPSFIVPFKCNVQCTDKLLRLSGISFVLCSLWLLVHYVGCGAVLQNWYKYLKQVYNLTQENKCCSFFSRTTVIRYCWGQRTAESIAATEKDKMPFVPVYGKIEGRGKVDTAQGQILMSQTCWRFLITNSCLPLCADDTAAAPEWGKSEIWRVSVGFLVMLYYGSALALSSGGLGYVFTCLIKKKNKGLT